MMKIGIGIPNQVRDVRPAIIPEWAAAAEEAGFSTLGTVGRMAYPGVMDTVTLAAAAGATSRIGLVSGILIAPAWPPALLAKEVAAIDGVSGGRLTLGVGAGLRPDDFVAEGYGVKGRGRRFDRDLSVYRDIWRGSALEGSSNPAVPAGTREIPLLFGALAPAGFERMARWGQGYIAGSLPPEMVAGAFTMARDSWRKAGRDGSPQLVALAYFSLGNAEEGRTKVYDYYSFLGDQSASMVVGGIRDSMQTVKEAVKAFGDLGVDELIFNPTTDDINEVARLAEAVL